MTIKERLDEMKDLEDGWLWGDGLAIPPEGLDWLAELFADFEPKPRLYPTAYAGVQAEWTVGEYEVSLEVDLKEKSGYWHEYNTRSEEWFEWNMDLKNEKNFIAMECRLEALA